MVCFFIQLCEFVSVITLNKIQQGQRKVTGMVIMSTKLFILTNTNTYQQNLCIECHTNVSVEAPHFSLNNAAHFLARKQLIFLKLLDTILQFKTIDKILTIFQPL